MIYVFLGYDTRDKNARIKTILAKTIPAGREEFNLDIVYADELKLRDLQERLKSLPVGSPSRAIVIKSAQNLRKEIKEYLLLYAREPFKKVILIIDSEPREGRDEFMNALSRHAKMYRCKKEERFDTFTLCRYIEQHRPSRALKLLYNLLEEGQRPERIIGGMRYAWDREAFNSPQAQKRVQCLLKCDREIKTGKFKPHRALEKMIIELSAFGPGKLSGQA